MYIVEIKDGARETNTGVERLARNRGTSLTFGSRRDAERLAAELSEHDGRVRIQAAAPQDPTTCDAYLIAFPRRSTRAPKPSEKQGLTFDVGANLYGELGRALVYGTYGVSPALRYYLYSELHGVSERTHAVHHVREPPLPEDLAASVSWSPDCLIHLRDRTSGELEQSFFCEIKTGAASFQRGQLEDMRAVSRHHGVLKIRVDIDRLPGEYTMRIDQVEGG